MSGIFVMTYDSTHAKMTVSPTLAAQVGSYTIAFNVCLTSYLTQCAQRQLSVTVIIGVTGITLALTAQSWTISSTTAFSYTLPYS
jgi:hypothetical protein